MTVGEAYSKANVQLPGGSYQRTRATIYEDRAYIYHKNGSILAEMDGPIEIQNATARGATWTNGLETWIIEQAGCGCGG